MIIIYGLKDEIRKQVDLLNQDKMHLTKENIQLLEKNKRLEDKVDKQDSELISVIIEIINY